ncbi:MAG TPA: PEP-CTERM sorting domain-containing protein [Candidatus Dormibacteraeota bacterium]|nr:PEP-CTERM sorting domain-containing protein [Candidatus Dormibacteraeota bacterium]
MSRAYALTVIVCALIFSAPAFAHSGELLNFQGLGDLQPVGDFYNGAGISGTPNYGITFSSNFLGLRSVFNGGSGAFSANPTGTPAIFINGTTGSTVTGTMNVNNGFASGLQFFYTAGFSETVTIWSGANGTGTVLATISLSPNNGGCTGFPTYCNWTSVGLNFSGTAKSVTFAGVADGTGIADITVGASTTAVPEPSTIALFGAGLAGVSLKRLRQLCRI